jgi:prepilin-type N-terminal cleavage/methylation domain-containing protein/prepilin-type processing-associated H-X9-DG protein
MKKTFTLLELLIVIAIIGLLMTLLLPSLSKARESAKLAVCMSNQRQLSRVLISGISENSGHFIAAQSPGQIKWVDVVEGKIKGTGPVSGYDFRQANSSGKTVWYCPSYDVTDTFGVNSWVHYGYNNSGLVGGGGSSKKDDDGVRSFGATGGLVLDIYNTDDPEDVALIGDSVHWAGDRGIWELSFNSYTYRHQFGKSMNFTFVDGHLENLKMSTLTTEQARLDKLKDGSWR